MENKKLKPVVLLTAALLSAAWSHAGQKPPKEPEVYDISAGKPVQIAAKKTKLPLIVYGEGSGQQGTFIPSGYMGDASALKMISTDFSAPISSSDSTKKGETCLKIQYSAKGPAGWAGIFWMTPANNWGKIKGAGYDLTKAKKLTFWMKGDKGGERVAAIKFGGIVGSYPDTDSGSLESIKLKKDWTRYEIDLEGKDLRHIVGGFVFAVTRTDNPRGATFYLDEIQYEGDPEAAPLADAAPALSSPTASAPVPAEPLKETRIVVPFPSIRATQTEEFHAQMQQVITLAASHPQANVLVEGHTDSAGPEDVNKRISLERAKAVADYLQKNGVAADRISVKGVGPDGPLTPDSNETAEGRAKNRRVEVTLVDGR